MYQYAFEVNRSDFLGAMSKDIHQKVSNESIRWLKAQGCRPTIIADGGHYQLVKLSAKAKAMLILREGEPNFGSLISAMGSATVAKLVAELSSTVSNKDLFKMMFTNNPTIK